MNNKINILVTLVTKDRPKHLDKLLNILNNQSLSLNDILIVDNDSTNETKEIINKWQSINNNIKTVDTKRNSGSAGGQHTAMAYARGNGYDAVWTMDDDCEPSENAFEEIAKKWYSIEDKNNWVLNSTVKRLDSDTLSFGLWHTENNLTNKPHDLVWEVNDLKKEYIDNNFFPNWGCFFNGTLVPCELMKRIGLPRPEFFIRGDEVEFLYRVLRYANVGTVLSSVVRHPHDSENFEDLANWKKYYSLRNSLIIEKWYFPENMKNADNPKKQWCDFKKYFIRKLIVKRTLVPKVNRLAHKDAYFEYFGRDVFNELK